MSHKDIYLFRNGLVLNWIELKNYDGTDGTRVDYLTVSIDEWIRSKTGGDPGKVAGFPGGFSIHIRIDGMADAMSRVES